MTRPLHADLPEFLREDGATQDLLRAFGRLLLGGSDDVGSVLGQNPLGLEATLAALPRYFTPGKTAQDGAPDDFLPWLSQWLAMSLRTDITYGVHKDLAKDNALRRSFISRMAQIYRYRGTRRGMQELLEVFTSRIVTINDEVDGQPHYFSILLDLDAIKTSTDIAEFEHVKELAHSVIRLEKPAHTRYLLIPIVETMRIGQRAQPPAPPPGITLPTAYFVRVGVNTRLGIRPGSPNPV